MVLVICSWENKITLSVCSPWLSYWSIWKPGHHLVATPFYIDLCVKYFHICTFWKIGECRSWVLKLVKIYSLWPLLEVWTVRGDCVLHSDFQIHIIAEYTRHEMFSNKKDRHCLKLLLFHWGKKLPSLRNTKDQSNQNKIHLALLLSSL